jgi:hypothetical protein
MKSTAFVLILLAASAAGTSSALAQNYPPNYNYNNNGSRETSGTIAVVNGTNIKLQEGRNIFLANGTAINPTGTTLRPGMQIYVWGVRGGNGAINATRIDVQSNSPYAPPGGSNPSRQTEGTIAVVNGTNVKLEDGRNIFLKAGTVINPTGTTLQPGMHVYVYGVRGGNGAINATRIDIQPGAYYR